MMNKCQPKYNCTNHIFQLKGWEREEMTTYMSTHLSASPFVLLLGKELSNKSKDMKNIHKESLKIHKLHFLITFY